MIDAIYIKNKGLMACRDIKKDEFVRISWIDYIQWINSEFYEIGNSK